MRNKKIKDLKMKTIKILIDIFNNKIFFFDFKIKKKKTLFFLIKH